MSYIARTHARRFWMKSERGVGSGVAWEFLGVRRELVLVGGLEILGMGDVAYTTRVGSWVVYSVGEVEGKI